MTYLLLFFSLFILSCSPILPIMPPLSSGEENIPGDTSLTSAPLLKIIAVNIGQGDSTLVIGPTGRTLLIDAGPVDSGQRVILPLLNELHVNHLNWMIATHYDADHIGGLGEVLKGDDGLLGTDDDMVPTISLYDRGTETDKDTSVYRDYEYLFTPMRHTLTPRTILDLGNGARATVIVVNGTYSDGANIHLNPDEENEASIGLLIEYGNFRYFTAGDLSGGGSPGGFETKDMETHAGEVIGDIDVLHAGHHGSASSSNERFLRLTQPEVVVISVGRDNDYHHPSVDTLHRLETISAEIKRTDQLGTITIESDGSDYQIK